MTKTCPEGLHQGYQKGEGHWRCQICGIEWDSTQAPSLPPQPDKRRKAQGEEIDISNGRLFLRILELERQVQYLTRRVDELTDTSRYIQRPIGGSR